VADPRRAAAEVTDGAEAAIVLDPEPAGSTLSRARTHDPDWYPRVPRNRDVRAIGQGGAGP
jgi:hypothetical protein